MFMKNYEYMKRIIIAFNISENKNYFIEILTLDDHNRVLNQRELVDYHLHKYYVRR